MIRHVVFFKVREGVAAADRDAALDALAGLHEVIDVIGTCEVGRDALRQPRSWDAVLVAAYADR